MSLVAKNIDLSVDAETHLDDVSFEMLKGKIYTLLGRTLSGKTTILKILAGLSEPDNGSLILDGVDYGRVPVWKRNVAMVYQQFINYPHLNVLQNVAFPLHKKGYNKANAQKEARQALARVGLTGFEDRKIQELSGGQQQRVALARALVKKADVLLLDEPLVNLDYKLREQLRDEFRELIKADEAQNSIVVFASTDPSEAMQLGGEIIVIDEGKVLQQGTCKDVFENPKNTKVAQITNEPAMNLFPGTITSGKVKISNSFDFDLPEHFSRLPEQEYIFGVRANEIFPSSSGQEFNVHLVEIVGSESLIHIEAPGIEAVALVEGVSELNENDVASFNLNTEYLYAFDKNGELVVSPYMGEK